MTASPLIGPVDSAITLIVAALIAIELWKNRP